MPRKQTTYPDRVKVGFTSIPVKCERLQSGVFGEFRQTPDPEIVVQTGMSRETTLGTILHEAIHAFDAHMAIGLTEKQVRRLDFAIHTLVRDNPEFVRLLAGTKG